MDSLERSLGLVERELSVRLPRALWAPGALGDATAIEPESLLDPRAGVVRGGELLPDALPFARLSDGGELALRFHPSGRPAEVIRAGPGPAWHPSDAVKAFPSEADHLRRRAEDALDSGLARLARQAGAAALAADLGVTRDTFADWLRDVRLVPEPSRASLRRLTGEPDSALLVQDWDGAAWAAGRALAARPELAWPGAVLGFHAEAAGRPAEAARHYAAALLALGATLDLALPLFARPLERATEALGKAWERCREPGEPVPTPSLAAALSGPEGCREFALAECDRARAEGRHADAWALGLRAGWQRHRGVDLDDVLGRMLWAAEALHAPAWTALARHHLRAWTKG
ncbi:MAG: hypothetical protein QM704_27810 [Anaeromyxobacteraceae bacterium]